MQRFKSSKNVVYNCEYHVIWCVKYRKKLLVGEVEKRLKAIVQDVADELLFEISEVETDKDHIHLLVSCDPQFGIHKCVKRMKGRSSKFLRDEFPHLRSRLPSLWTNSYFCASIGGAPISGLKQYIRQQQHK